jgi:hypothetical protein
MRARLRDSERPNRIFDRVLQVATKARHVGRKRVLDSTPLYDAVATQDTVTMIRSSIRSLLKVAPDQLRAELRGALKRPDDYLDAGKPRATGMTLPRARRSWTPWRVMPTGFCVLSRGSR